MEDLIFGHTWGEIQEKQNGGKPLPVKQANRKKKAKQPKVEVEPKICWAAIRQADGNGYIDTSTIGCLPDEAIEKARANEKEIPHYYTKSCNNLLRIAKIEIREVVE